MFQNGNDNRNKMNLESEIKDCWIDLGFEDCSKGE
jgi:hypothetical protein